MCDGTADVIVSGGVAPYTYNWVHNGATTSNQTDLCAGAYFVEVSDANGCLAVASVVINDGPEIFDNATITASTCGAANGEVMVNASGGAGGFVFNWTPIVAGQGTNHATGLAPGIYQLEITDAANCSQIFTYTINGIDGPQATSIATNPNCNGFNDGSVLVTVTGADPFTFDWKNAAGMSISADEDLNGRRCWCLYFGNY